MQKIFFRKGVTLLEIIIVIALIAILAVIAVFYLRGQIFKGNDARRKADLQRIQTAIEEYERDHNCYPTYIKCGNDPTQPIYPYLQTVPCDPVTQQPYGYDYDINKPVCPDWYRLFGTLQSTGTDANLAGSFGPGGIYNYYVGSPTAPAPQYTQSVSGFYGCKSGTCMPILWNSQTNRPECSPNYQDPTCFGQCYNPAKECK